MAKLKNKVAIVTGGASGIGKSTVKRFVEEGAKVVLADVSNKGENIANQLGNAVYFFYTDVSNEKNVKELIDFTVEKFGRLDIMFANAGIAKDAPAADLTYDDWKATIDINLSGVFLCDKYAIQQFKKQGDEGVIVNCGSIHSFVGKPGVTSYASAKGGVKLLTQTLATDYANQGIRINAVAPGYIDTPLLSNVDEKVYSQLTNLHPQGRLGKPEEVASVVTFLASNEASFVNGTSILVDGGYTAQ